MNIVENRSVYRVAVLAIVPFAASVAVGCADDRVGIPSGGASSSAASGGSGGEGGSGGGGMGIGNLFVVGDVGEIALVDLKAPWTIAASSDLGRPTGKARCFESSCYVMHPSPADAVTIVSLADLSAKTVSLPRGANPQDIAFIDTGHAVISQKGRAALAQLDLGNLETTEIDLSALAGIDGPPMGLGLANCGPRVFLQIAEAPIVAVIDVSRQGTDRIVDADPTTPGIQGVALELPSLLDMQADCGRLTLYLSEPQELISSVSGVYQRVDLAALQANDWPHDLFGKIGGFVLTSPPDVGWFVIHTEFGPGPSTHLSLFDPSIPQGSLSVYSTFSPKEIDDLALDVATHQLFFPDSCNKDLFSDCEMGVHVFDSSSGSVLSLQPIDVGFPPHALAISQTLR